MRVHVLPMSVLRMTLAFAEDQRVRALRNRYFQILIGRNVREHLSHAVGPDNSQLIHYLGRSQTNVNRQVRPDETCPPSERYRA